MGSDTLKKYIETGKVVNTHGVMGEIKVKPWSDSPDFLTHFDRFYLSDKGGRALKCEKCRVHKDMVLIKIKGIDTVEQAEQLRGKVLYIDRSDAQLDDGEYFIQDLIGCDVYDQETGKLLGRLADITQTGANDVWHIEFDGRTYLVPAIPDVLGEISLEEKKAVIRPLKGIFDDED